MKSYANKLSPQSRGNQYEASYKLQNPTETEPFACHSVLSATQSK